MENDAASPGTTQDKGSSLVGRSLNWLFSQRHFHIKLLSGTVVGVIVIVFLAGVFLLVTYRNHVQETLRTHTVEVLRLSSVVENDIAALETAHRGYLLTGNAAYREELEKRRMGVKERIEDLTALVVNSGPQRKRLKKVQELVKTWANTIAIPEMNARQPKSPPAAALAAATAANPTDVLGGSILDQARE